MAHPEQMDFVRRIKKDYPHYFVNKKVIEFGSLNLNGTVRDFFDLCDYTGVDIVDGDGVDVVSLCHKYDQDIIADVVISCEMLEHDFFWVRSIEKMYSLLKTGGALIFTCATDGRPEHGTVNASPSDSPATNNYYRNLYTADIMGVFLGWYRGDFSFPYNPFSKMIWEINEHTHDLYFFGIKS